MYGVEMTYCSVIQVISFCCSYTLHLEISLSASKGKATICAVWHVLYFVLCNTPLGVSVPKAECRCFDREASLYCSLCKILMIPAWKPLSGTSKDQIANMLKPKWKGYILQPQFGSPVIIILM